MNVDDGAEAAELRRLLKEKTEQALQLGMELELARRQAKELHEQLERIGRVIIGDGPVTLEQVEEAVRKAQEVYRERSARILHVFGCSACQGEHRTIWTTELEPAVRKAFGKLELDAQRAYVCPRTLRVVLVSNESEETAVHE